MKTLAAVLLLSVALGATFCATVKPVTDAGKVCATEAGKATVDSILPQVNETIGCSIADTADIPGCMATGLEALARQFGQDFLMCALEQIASAKFATPGDANQAIKQRRARAYIDSRKVAGVCPTPAGCAPVSPSVAIPAPRMEHRPDAMWRTVAGICPEPPCYAESRACN